MRCTFTAIPMKADVKKKSYDLFNTGKVTVSAGVFYI